MTVVTGLTGLVLIYDSHCHCDPMAHIVYLNLKIPFNLRIKSI